MSRWSSDGGGGGGNSGCSRAKEMFSLHKVKFLRSIVVEWDGRMHLEQCFLHCFNRCFYVFPEPQMLSREAPLGAFSTDGSAPFLSSAAPGRVRKGSCISPSFILACQSQESCILTIKLSSPLLTHVLNSSFLILSLWGSKSAVNVRTTLKSLNEKCYFF